MNKNLKIIVAVVCLSFLAFQVVYAASDLFSVGRSADSNLVRIDSTGAIIGPRSSYEVLTTGDTLTAIESGKTFIFQPAITGVYTTTNTPYRLLLPSASVGLEYTLTTANLEFISIEPEAADTIKYSSCLAGEQMANPASATGESVTLICGAANTWYVKHLWGTWTDNGQ